MLVEIRFVAFGDLDAWLKKIASEAYFPFVFSGTTCGEILSVLPQKAVEEDPRTLQMRVNSRMFRNHHRS